MPDEERYRKGHRVMLIIGIFFPVFLADRGSDGTAPRGGGVVGFASHPGGPSHRCEAGVGLSML